MYSKVKYIILMFSGRVDVIYWFRNDVFFLKNTFWGCKVLQKFHIALLLIENQTHMVLGAC